MFFVKCSKTAGNFTTCGVYIPLLVGMSAQGASKVPQKAVPEAAQCGVLIRLVEEHRKSNKYVKMLKCSSYIATRIESGTRERSRRRPVWRPYI